jgi:DNA-binding transcriptional ArsR family regulator
VDVTNPFPPDDFRSQRKVATNNSGEQSLRGITERLTGNSGVTLSEVMTRKSKPPIAIYSALADATRCRIVEILLAGPIPVHTLADAFSISRPAISRHLRVLKTAGLVAEVKKGRENLYALRSGKLAPATIWINSIVSPAVDRSTQTSPPPALEDSRPAALAAPAPIVVQQAEPAPIQAAETASPEVIRSEKAPRAPRVAKPEPAISQMGFDF